jgi:hypothetical protein
MQGESATAKLATARVLHIMRGNMGVVLPITDDAATQLPVHDLIGYVMAEVLKMEGNEPGRASRPVHSRTFLALRIHGRDTPLSPTLPLAIQTEGHWTDRELPVQGRSEITARLPVLELELIDAMPSLITVSR